MKCFYHNDADGKCAGFWVHYRARLAPHTGTMDFIEMSYEKPFPMYGGGGHKKAAGFHTKELPFGG